MHRQSFGSPSSKLRIHGGEENSIADDQKRQLIIHDDDDDGKDIKPRRLSFSPSSLSPTSPSFTSLTKPEKLIHLIPVLTLLCLLILYLNSHSPSQSDLAQFNGFKHPSKHLVIWDRAPDGNSDGQNTSNCGFDTSQKVALIAGAY
ncbi:Detected protein of unknown function [Hibiscus syriacus]|uniref:Uncharacterized protein n=1 Tax=Hibiscus syriacus TaxID=106335 RepID=A0A6A3CJF1_HIBSY|nr:Detected protein of unknown function [Hibiscus syriacus]